MLFRHKVIELLGATDPTIFCDSRTDGKVRMKFYYLRASSDQIMEIKKLSDHIVSVYMHHGSLCVMFDCRVRDLLYNDKDGKYYTLGDMATAAVKAKETTLDTDEALIGNLTAERLFNQGTAVQWRSIGGKVWSDATDTCAFGRAFEYREKPISSYDTIKAINALVKKLPKGSKVTIQYPETITTVVTKTVRLTS